MYSCSGLEQLWEQAGGSPAARVHGRRDRDGRVRRQPERDQPDRRLGLWQINASNGSLATLNPFQNAQSAITLSDNGTNWDPWTTYTGGAYSGKC